MTRPELTSWRLLGVPGRPRLQVTLVVSTQAPAVVDAIEAAAAAHGIVLQRRPAARPDRDETEGE
jgi:hypothetical protein